MSVGRVAMIALFAALTAGCAAPRESGTADAVLTPEQESGPAVAGDGTRSTPASQGSADDVPASVEPPVTQPAWFTPDEVHSAAASSTTAASAPVPPETPEPVRPQTVSSRPKTPPARPAREEIIETRPVQPDEPDAGSVQAGTTPAEPDAASGDLSRSRRPAVRGTGADEAAGASATPAAEELSPRADPAGQESGVAGRAVRAPQHVGEAALDTAPVGPTESPEETEESMASLRDRSEAGGRGAREGQAPRGAAFSQHAIGDCAVIRQLGHSIALSRSRGAGESVAIRAGIDRMVDEFGLARDQRTKFTSRVYGLLVYRLDAGHSTQALTSYAHAVCRIYHDSNRIIPVDPASERAINDRLRACDRNTVARDELEDCVLRGLVEIVDRAT